ncbi:MAG: hypothetical protein ABI855_18105 [Bacteroidota bacterium]
MKDTFAKFIFVIVLLVLCLPLAQQTGSLFKEKPLDGAFVNPPEPELSFENWFTGEFQESYTKFFNSIIGFRPFFIRLRNQISFSFFNQSAEPDFFIGRNNNFFNSANIGSVTGSDFTGIGFIDSKMKKLKLIQDSMQARGVPVLFVIAPGKANFFTEDIPHNFKKADSTITNYYWISKKLNEYKINHIDFNKYFLQLKDTSQNLLFTKAGLHWSDYGLALSFDSLIRYFKTFNKNNIGDFTIRSFSKSRIPKQTDVDQENSLNLLLPLKYEEYTYPHWEIKKNNGALPKLLDVGDSFFMTFIIDSIADKFFDFEYWYYHHSVVYKKLYDPTSKDIDNINYFDHILNKEYILIMSSEGTWNRCGYDFIDNLYSYFTDRNNANLVLNMNFLLAIIKDKEGWLRYVKFYETTQNTRSGKKPVSAYEIITKQAYGEMEWGLHLAPEVQSSVQATENYLSNTPGIKKIIASVFGNRMRFEKETIHIIAVYLQSKNINAPTLAGAQPYPDKK